ncbi:unnamed protein product [Closterium sp. NIES-54]
MLDSKFRSCLRESPSRLGRLILCLAVRNGPTTWRCPACRVALPCLSRRPALPVASPCCLSRRPAAACRVALPCPRAALLAAAPPCPACTSPWPARTKPPCCPHRPAARAALLHADLLASALLPARHPAGSRTAALPTPPCCCPPCCAPPCWPTPCCPRAALLAAAPLFPAHAPPCPALAACRSSLAFDTWLDVLHMYLLSDSRDSVSLFDHMSGASLAPPATDDSATRSQWLTRDTAARLAVRNHLPLAERAHFGQHKTSQALYDAVVARYSSPATAAIGRLILPYLFPELSAFATVEDLATHLCTNDACYRDALLAEFLDRNPPSMFITLYFKVTRLPDSLRAVLLVALLAHPSLRGVPPPPLPPPTPLLLLLTSLVPRMSGLLLLLVGSATAARARVARVVAVAAGVVVVEAGEAVDVAEVVAAVGVVAGVGASVEAVVAAVGVGVAVVAAVGVVAAAVVADRVELFSGEVLAVTRDSSSSVGARPLRPSSFVSGLLDMGRLGVVFDAHMSFAQLLRFGVDIFALDYDAILAAMYALSVGAKGDCYLCVPPDPVIGASESALPVTAPAEALHTFTLDSRASRYFFRDSTTLTPLPAPVPVRLADPSGGPVLARSSTALSCPAVPSSSLLGPVAASCSCRLLSNQTLLSHPTLLWHHRLGHPSLPRLCDMHSRLLVSGLPRSLPPLPPSPASPCLPCIEGQWRAAPHSSSFPPTIAPLQTLHMDVWGPARVSGQDRDRYFLLVVDDYTRYTTVFPLRSKGEVPDVLIPWIRAVHLQLRERFRQDLRVLRLYSDIGGEFSSDLLRDFCRGEGIHQSFTLPSSTQQSGIAEHRIGLVTEVARTSMIHAAAPHFLWSFAVRYAAHQFNLWPHVSLLETSPTLRWTGKVGDASVFRGPAPSGVSQVDPLPGTVPVEVVVDSEPRGAEPEGAEPGGAESEGAESGGAEPGGAEPEGTEPEGVDSGGAEPRGTASAGGPAGASPRVSPRREPLSPQQLHEWFAQRTRLKSGAAGAGGSPLEPSGPYPELVDRLMVLRYFCSTSGMWLVLGGWGPVVLTGHVNASWVDDLAAQRSSEGYTFSLGFGSIS